VDSENGKGFLQLTGLWKSKSGKAIQGRIGALRVIIMPNAYKKEEKHPDYIAYVAAAEEYKKPEPKKSDANEDVPF
jgi:hypothetical protein